MVGKKQDSLDGRNLTILNTHRSEQQSHKKVLVTILFSQCLGEREREGVRAREAHILVLKVQVQGQECTMQ